MGAHATRGRRHLCPKASWVITQPKMSECFGDEPCVLKFGPCYWADSISFVCSTPKKMFGPPRDPNLPSPRMRIASSKAASAQYHWWLPFTFKYIAQRLRTSVSWRFSKGSLGTLMDVREVCSSLFHLTSSYSTFLHFVQKRKQMREICAPARYCFYN